MPNRERFICRVIVPTIIPPVRHFWGLPPSIAEEERTRISMDHAQILTIECNSDGVFLNRFLINGLPVGDTWHESVEAAKDQSVFEFGDGLSEWLEVPREERDALTFGMAQLKDS